MLLSNARNKNQGFTLIETLIILVIIGILSAIAAPSFLSMYKRNKVNDALIQVQGALQEAQRQAIRNNKSCTVTIDTTNKKVTAPCLVTGDRILDSSISIATNETSIQFSIKGTITLADAGTVVLSNPDTSKKSCLVISSPLGIMRTGEYSGSTSPISKNNCTTSP